MAARSKRSPDPLARFRAICASLPGVIEKEAWGEPTFRVGGKMFAMFDGMNPAHQPGLEIWLHTPTELQEALVAADPDRFFVPPYVGHKGWVAVRIDAGLDWGVLAGLAEEAHRMTAPKRILKQSAAERPRTRPGRSSRR